jgi:signal peptidase I
MALFSFLSRKKKASGEPAADLAQTPVGPTVPPRDTTPLSTPNRTYASPAPNQPRWQKQSKKEGILSMLTTILLLVSVVPIALLLVTFVFQSYQVEGPSMNTTLADGDRLIVVKTGKTWANIWRKNYVPKRGEIIVFIKKGLYEGDSGREKQLIKRVIGVPGDRVVVKDGLITVYNAANPDGFLPDKTGDWASVITTTDGNVDITVPAGQVFVCGDNRGNSLDSRSFGTIAAHEIIGRAMVRILPVGNATRL